jgi:hypothetical protein
VADWQHLEGNFQSSGCGNHKTTGGAGYDGLFFLFLARAVRACTLRMAAISGRVEIIRVLLDRGADVNAQGGIWGSALGLATDSGRLEAVRLLLDRGAEVNAPAGIHRNALAVALHHGHDEMVLLLREHGAKEVVV